MPPLLGCLFLLCPALQVLIHAGQPFRLRLPAFRLRAGLNFGLLSCLPLLLLPLLAGQPFLLGLPLQGLPLAGQPLGLKSLSFLAAAFL